MGCAGSPLQVRLLTGMGRYNEMTYIFDLLHQNHRFEMLLRKKVDTDRGQVHTHAHPNRFTQTHTHHPCDVWCLESALSLCGSEPSEVLRANLLTCAWCPSLLLQSCSLKTALLDYIKRCLPADSEKHNMVALCFSMRREIGENHEMAARTQLKMIESQEWG